MALFNLKFNRKAAVVNDETRARDLIKELSKFTPSADKCKRLIEEGVDLKKVVGFNTSLTAAVNANQVDVVRALLDKGGDVNESEIDSGFSTQRSLLMISAQNGNEEMFDLLISRKANAHHVSPGNYSAIYAAVESGCLPIVQKLIVLGVELELKGANGYTPLFIAQLNKSERKQVHQVLEEAVWRQRFARKDATATVSAL